jgi:uncharacterized protein (DUF1800 family)
MNAAAQSAIAANRFGLGARPRELADIAGLPREWLRVQLQGGAPLLEAADLTDSATTLARALALRHELQQEKQAAARAEGTPSPPQLQRVAQLLRPVYVSEARARFAQAVGSGRPFLERLVQFWANHFAVSVDKPLLAGLAGSFEREAIRPHVLGRFADLLLAVETHPAMLLYLDNQLSLGPHSSLAQRAGRHADAHRLGINENLAREILELHTLGVGGGYTQTDVTTFAEVLSGWSLGGGRGRLAGGEPGRFLFRPELHEPGAKLIRNTRYPDSGFSQGVAVLNDLARAPATARFLATKLARHFVADEPPPQLVAALAGAFTATEGDLPSVYRALIDAHETWEQELAKYKTPNDFITSTYRGLALPVEGGAAALAPFELLGQRTWQPGSPAGWPDRSADWDGASALLKRIEWADRIGARLGSQCDAQQAAPQLLGANLTAATRTAITRAASAGQATTLLLASPEFLRR